MTSFLDSIRRAPRALLLTLAGLLVIGAVVVLVGGGSDKKTVTAHFSRAVSVFPGSEVRILGVPVGSVTAVVPEGATVRVEMGYLTNMGDRRRLLDPVFRDVVAEGVLVGVKRLYLQGQDDQPTGTFTFSDVLARELAREEPAPAVSRRI